MATKWKVNGVKMECDWMIQCTGLTKRYGDFAALSECDFRVSEGDVYGLLGPNGAGKTTLIRLMLGYLHPTSGECRVAGKDALRDSVEVRRRVSYLPGDARLPRHMRGKGVLQFFAAMHPDGDLNRSLAVAKRLDLDLKTRVAFMSTGMRQKLALSVVLGPRTPLLILDEPTANLDPTVRGEVLKCVTEARHEGRTVVFSSHVLSEIEETCSRVAFLRKGRLVHELAMSDLFQQHRIHAVLRDKAASDANHVQESILNRAPEGVAIQVRAKKSDESEPNWNLSIDTSGDLAPMLSWLNTLGLHKVRIEPLGLRAVYDAVHFDDPIPASSQGDPSSDSNGSREDRNPVEAVS